MIKVLIVNGPNLNLLGKRETDIYGEETFEDFLEELKEAYFDYKIDYFQSNHEGELIDMIQSADQKGYRGVVLNAGGYTHTSVAIRDAIAAIKTPVIEVHISNIFAREEFRHQSLISGVCKGIISGFGMEGYAMALDTMAD